jgi:probable HAF family extracellular repeat protein
VGNPIGSAFLRTPRFATTFALALLAAGIAPAFAASVTITGENGAPGATGQRGGAGGAATATATSSGPSNSATAIGGNGGPGGPGRLYYYPPGPGGGGGAASSTAAAWSANDSASATATSTGGNGGRGGPPIYPCRVTCIPGRFGNSGAATSSATASSTTGSASATANSTGGVGGVGGTAFAKSDAKNSSGEVITTASAPGGGVRTSPSALTAAGVGSVSLAPANITPGRVVSNAVLVPGDFGAGAMSDAALNGPPEYEATAVFDFTTSKSETLQFTLPSDNFVGTGFDVTLEIFANATSSIPTFSQTFSSLSGLGAAELFFDSHPLLLGAGRHSIALEYLLNYTSGAPYSPGYGLAFTYDFASSAVAATPITAAFDLAARPAIPEPSTWAMVLIGFAGLAFAGYRARVGPAVIKKRDVTDETERPPSEAVLPPWPGPAVRRHPAGDEDLHRRGKLMKPSIGPIMLVITLTGFATRVEAQTVSWPPPHYAVINLGTLGGSGSNGYGGVTNNGWVSGDSFLSGDATEHAFVWRDGVITDLGTVGGANSSTPVPQKNTHGLIVGQSQGSRIDPLGEYWGVAYGCNTPPGPNNNPPAGLCTGWQNLQFGFVWQKGVMTALPTLGGNNSSALGDNNLGQVAGWAETPKAGTNCVPPQQLEIKAVVYGPKRGEVHILPTFPGDDLAGALGINDNGDVVGLSGGCFVPDYQNLPAAARHAVLWRNGRVSDLGGLGGVMNNAAFVINNAGQIVGTSNPTGDATTYAVLWQNGAITNLGTLPGDFSSVAADINAQGQVVGTSCDVNFNCRAFLWDHGVMIDLNSLVPKDTPLYLTSAEGINDFGEIAGTAVLKSNPNEQPAFLAIPTLTGQIVGNSGRKINLPENIRASLQRRLRLGHFGDHATAQQ